MDNDNTQHIDATLVTLSKELRSGVIDRRQFLGSAIALGLSVAAATMLASRASYGAGTKGNELDVAVDFTVPKDLGISDSEWDTLTAGFQTALVAVLVHDNPQSHESEMKPKKRTKRAKF